MGDKKLSPFVLREEKVVGKPTKKNDALNKEYPPVYWDILFTNHAISWRHLRLKYVYQSRWSTTNTGWRWQMIPGLTPRKPKMEDYERITKMEGFKPNTIIAVVMWGGYGKTFRAWHCVLFRNELKHLPRFIQEFPEKRRLNVIIQHRMKIEMLQAHLQREKKYLKDLAVEDLVMDV